MSCEPRALHVEALSLDEWKQFDAAHPAPTFFARPAWAIAHSRSYGVTPSPLRVVLDDGSRHIVPLISSRGRIRPLLHLVGMPIGTYTAVMDETNGALTSGERLEGVMRAVLHYGDDVIVNPWPMGPQPHYGRSLHHETSVLDVGGGFEPAWALWDGRARRMAGQAERRGAVARDETSAAAVDDYYELVLESTQRWGLREPTFRKSLLSALIEEAAGDAQIWMVRYEGSAVAGGVIVYGSDELFFWSAAMRTEFTQLRPSNLLNKALLQSAAQRGVRWYNLGASEGLPGVRRFKDSIGAAPVEYFTYEHASTRYRAWKALRGLMSRSASTRSESVVPDAAEA